LQRFEYKLNISKEKTSGCDDDLSTCDDLTTMVIARELKPNRELFPDHFSFILHGALVGSLWPTIHYLALLLIIFGVLNNSSKG
jgi:hypothetical protein